MPFFTATHFAFVVPVPVPEPRQRKVQMDSLGRERMTAYNLTTARVSMLIPLTRRATGDSGTGTGRGKYK